MTPDHACLPTAVGVIVTKLAKLRVRPATRNKKVMATMLEGVIVFVAVEAKPQVFSNGVSASGVCKEAAKMQRVIGIK